MGCPFSLSLEYNKDEDCLEVVEGLCLKHNHDLPKTEGDFIDKVI